MIISKIKNILIKKNFNFNFFPHLVSPGNQVNIHPLREILHNIGSKNIRDTSRILRPSVHVILRIRPQQVHGDGLVWRVERSLDARQLLPRLDLRTQAAVHTEDPARYQGAQWESVEQVLKIVFSDKKMSFFLNLIKMKNSKKTKKNREKIFFPNFSSNFQTKIFDKK